MIAEVIVDIAASETDRIYDYLCDENTVVGSRVRAPFGGKTVPGFVMRIKENSELPPEKLKRVFPCPDELPALNAECLSLAEKLAARYRVPKALTLRLFLPSEMRTGKVRELMRNYAVLTVPVSEMKLSITAVNGRIDKNHDAILEASISLADNSEVDSLIKKIKQDKRIYDVHRTT